MSGSRAGEARLLRLFREMEKAGGHEAYSCPTMADYVALIMGVNDIAARERMRVARALGKLRRIERALSDGLLSYAKVRALTRVAALETEKLWLKRALELTAQQLEWEVARCRKGDGIPRRYCRMHPIDNETTRMIVDLPADEMELLRQAIDKVRKAAGGQLSTPQALVQMAAQILEQELEDVSSADRYQVIVHVDGAPGRSSGQDLKAVSAGKGDSGVSVDKDKAGTSGGNNKARTIVGKDRSGLSAGRDEAEASAADVSAETSDGGSGSGLERVDRADEGPGHLDTVCGPASIPAARVEQLLCDASIAVAKHSADGTVEFSRRARTVPAATREAVLRRDGHRCRVPGCTRRLWLELHHIESWLEGGDHSLGNLLTMCRGHHQEVHEGRLRIVRQPGRDGPPRFFVGEYEITANGLIPARGG
ncbi:MAG: hypothetical protein GF355_09505 [Candidatus Eisenbacteria bacterium]|nr:hypothetical protein [Candidatus Eisenbacteria bacterium]